MAATALRLFAEPDLDSDVQPSSTFADAVERYAQSRGIEPTTLAGYRTTAKKLDAWASMHRSLTPMHVTGLDSQTIGAFLDWRYAEAQKAGGNPGRTVNKSREHIRAVLQWLVDEAGELPAMPRLPAKREQRTAAGLFFFTDAELEQLYWATYRMERPRGWAGHQPIGAYWRAALAMLVTYGVDTQLLFPHTARARPLRWGNVYAAGLAPDRSTKHESPHGWLVWSRQKTGHQFCAPMTDVVAAHLQSIAPSDRDDEASIFGVAGGGRPCERFQELVGHAKIAEKLDTRTGQKVPWTLKDIRKTCATRHDENLPGSSSVVLGHAGDGLADVTRRHYRNESPLLFRAITTISYPPAFRAILDDTIKPPADLLFAK